MTGLTNNNVSKGEIAKLNRRSLQTDLVDNKLGVLKTKFVQDFFSGLDGVPHYFTQLINTTQQQQQQLLLQQLQLLLLPPGYLLLLLLL